MSSAWCDPKKWYKDYLLTQPNNAIPKNKINNTNITSKNFTFVIADNKCFYQIPYLNCNNLTIVGSDSQSAGGAIFSCAILDANIVQTSGSLSLEHWDASQYCEYTMGQLLLGSGCALNKIICYTAPGSGTGIIGSGNTFTDCYIDSDTISLIDSKIGISNSLLISKIQSKSGVLDNTKISAGPILEGNFLFKNSGSFDGSGVGSFELSNYAYVDKNGLLVGNIILYSGGQNFGTLVGDNVRFHGSGSANFGTVSGNCIFTSEAVNSGTISGTCIFESGAINYGVVNGLSFFYDATSTDTSTLNQFSFFSGSINSGTLKNGGYFYNSFNSGTIASGESATFIGSQSINAGSVTADSILFSSGALNSGLINNNKICNIVFDSGINIGKINTVSGIIIFKNSSINALDPLDNNFHLNYGGSCEAKSVSFYDNSTNECIVTGPSGSVFKFFNKSVNSGQCKASDTVTLFYNNSINCGPSNTYFVPSDETNITSGIFYHNSTNAHIIEYGEFYNYAINQSGILSTGLFYDYAINNAVSGNSLYFCNKSINSGYFNFATFRDQSINNSSGIGAVFYNKSINASGVSDKPIYYAFFFDSSINNISGNITGSADFYNSSINSGSFTGILHPYIKTGFSFFNKSINNGNCTFCFFSGQSQNKNYVNSGNFYQESLNTNLGSGNNFTFYDSSINKGSILASGQFYNNSINDNPGYIYGTGVFYDNSINNSRFDQRNLDYRRLLPNLPPIYSRPVLNFFNSSINNGNTIACVLSFYDSGVNKGYIRSTPSNIHIFKEDNTILQLVFNTQNKTFQYEPITVADFLSFYYLNTGNIISFVDKSKNYGTLEGFYKYIFKNEASNYGKLLTFPPVPNLHKIATFTGDSKESGCYNFADIPKGKVEFTYTTNYGNTLFPTFNNSVNKGNIFGQPTQEFPLNTITLPKFDTILFNNSINSGQMYMYAEFDTSGINAGNIYSSGKFTNKSINLAYIKNNAIFEDSDNAGDIGGDITMSNGYCICCNIRGSGNFMDSKYYSNSFIQALEEYPYRDSTYTDVDTTGYIKLLSLGKKFNGNDISLGATFSDSVNYGGIIYQESNFINSKNFGTLNGPSNFNNSTNTYNAIINSKTIFFNNSINSGIIYNDSIFIDSTNNGLINGKSIFASGSTNNANVDGDAEFYSSSTNNGIVRSNAIFIQSSNGNDNNNFDIGLAGTVSGSAIFNNLSQNVCGVVKEAVFDNTSCTALYSYINNEKIISEQMATNFGTKLCT